MIKKDKNKSRLKAKSKILALGLLLFIILIGFFSPIEKVNAEELGFCTVIFPNKNGFILQDRPKDTCVNRADSPAIWTFESYTASNPDPSPGVDHEERFKTIHPATMSKETSEFAKKVSEAECGLGGWITGGSLAGCLLQFVYYTFYMLGSLLLWLAALLFNFLIIYTIDSELLRSGFISSAWETVRDLSNIFFILILLYIAIKIILDFGGSEAKKMIAKVIIIALLINFSMFFTRVIIDSSNILALIFYDKIKTEKTNEPGVEALDPNNKKDISGGLTKSFNPAYQLPPEFFTNAGNIQTQAEGMPKNEEAVSVGLLIGITVVSGLIMLFAAYALFISSLSFLGRLIELFILIIFSPFAFMSSTIPLLSSAEYLGWDNWFKRLLKVAFMAPIFMFFLYFIFLLLHNGGKMFKNLVTDSKSSMVALLNLIIPALVILILLNKATEFAKKGSGALGEAIIKGTKIAAGVGLGVAGGLAIGGAAKGLQATVGKGSEKFAKSATAKRWIKEGRFGSDSLQKTAHFLGGRDFDARKGAVGGLLKSAENVTGLKFGSASKFLLKEGGGYRGDRERAEKKRDERSKWLKVSEDEPLQQDLNKKQEESQQVKNVNSHEIEQIEARREVADKNVKSYEQTRNASRSDYEIAKDKLDNIAEKTDEEKEYNKKKDDFDKKKAAFDAIVASGIATTDPTYTAAETAKNTAETAKNTAATAVSAINPTYVALKDAFDETRKNYELVNKEYNKRAKSVRDLIDHRKAIKDAKAGDRSVADTGDDLERTNIAFAATEESVKRARAVLAAAVTPVAKAAAQKALEHDLEIEEEIKKIKEIANAVHASAEYGYGQSINDYEDKILPAARQKIEDGDRSRLISYAKISLSGGSAVRRAEKTKQRLATANASLETAKTKAIAARGTSGEEEAEGLLKLATLSFNKAAEKNEKAAKILREAEASKDYSKLQVGVIRNAFRTLTTTAGDDRASRNASAHKMIMEVKVKN